MEARNILIIDDQDGDNGIINLLSSAGYSYGVVDHSMDLNAILANNTSDAIVAVSTMDNQAMIQKLEQQAIHIPVVMVIDEKKNGEKLSLNLLEQSGDIQKSTRQTLLHTLQQKFFDRKEKAPKMTATQKSFDSPLALSLIQVAIPSHVAVLIGGDYGAGKEVIAHYIHDHSDRMDQPFIAINCALTPERMLEANLLGYEQGALPGAQTSYAGKFEQAQGGTLLLDDISGMSLQLQEKLVQILKRGKVKRLGGRHSVSLNVRVIATSHCNLQKKIITQHFREDLYYKLNASSIHWTPLCERPLDIIPMANYLIHYHASRVNRTTPYLSARAKRALTEYAWPGNEREMDDVIQHALIMQPGVRLDQANFLLNADLQTISISPDLPSRSAEIVGLKDQEYSLIMSVLHRTKGNRTKAAELLSLSPRTLRYKLAKMRKQGMDIPVPASRPRRSVLWNKGVH